MNPHHWFDRAVFLVGQAVVAAAVFCLMGYGLHLTFKGLARLVAYLAGGRKP